jgi:hypothetical protein
MKLSGKKASYTKNKLFCPEVNLAHDRGMNIFPKLIVWHVFTMGYEANGLPGLAFTAAILILEE